MSIRRTAWLGVVGLGLGLLTGCPSQSEGNLITALSKVAGGTMTDLTATEVLILIDRIGDVNPQVAGITVTETEADAAVEFLQANDINTVSDIQALVNNPAGIVVPDSVESLVESVSLPEAAAFRP